VAAWKLPLVVVAIVVPVAAAFFLGGPGVGVAVGALAAFGILVVAARRPPRPPLGEDPTAAGKRRLLLVISCPVEDAAAIGEIAAEVESGGSEDTGRTEVMVLAPARIGFLDRWASDLERARREAQRSLVITVASLAKAGVAAEGRVGDEDLVQAVEDQMGTFAATDVILVTPAAAEESQAAATAAAELEQRLRTGFRHLALNG
jgi:hypothetical protein